MIPLVHGLVERHGCGNEISFAGRNMVFCMLSAVASVSEIFTGEFHHILLHLLLIDVCHHSECHLFRRELLSRKPSQFLAGDSLHGSHCSEYLSTQRMALEKHLFETVVNIFRRSVLV